MSRHFPSIWAYNCAHCGEDHPRGTLSMFNGDNLIVAANCDGAETEETKHTLYSPTVDDVTKDDACIKCFLVHAPGQEGCY